MNVISTGTVSEYDHSYTYTLVIDSIEDLKKELETEELGFDSDDRMCIPHEIHSDYDCTGKVCSEYIDLIPINDLVMVVHYEGLDL